MRVPDHTIPASDDPDIPAYGNYGSSSTITSSSKLFVLVVVGFREHFAVVGFDFVSSSSSSSKSSSKSSSNRRRRSHQRDLPRGPSRPAVAQRYRRRIWFIRGIIVGPLACARIHFTAHPGRDGNSAANAPSNQSSSFVNTAMMMGEVLGGN